MTAPADPYPRYPDREQRLPSHPNPVPAGRVPGAVISLAVGLATPPTLLTAALMAGDTTDPPGSVGLLLVGWLAVGVGLGYGVLCGYRRAHAAGIAWARFLLFGSPALTAIAMALVPDFRAGCFCCVGVPAVGGGVVIYGSVLMMVVASPAVADWCRR